MPGPLSHIRVLDLSRVLAGPWTGQNLADLGAEVIKVERPGKGDDTRQWGPPWTEQSSSYFECVNRSKQSMALDLHSLEGQALARSLAARADVVVENFLTGTMERLGLGHDEVASVNPGVIYCSITGFGGGPGAALPGYDFVVQALGGLMSITGAAAGDPTKVGVALVDVLTGKDAVIAVLAALRERSRSGRGQRVEVNLLSSLLGSLANQASAYLTTGRSPGRLGNQHPSIAPYETLRCADGLLAVACGNDRQFARLCAVLDVPELAEDPRFATNPDRVARRGDLVAELEKVLGSGPVESWSRLLTTAGVAAGPVGDIGTALAMAESLGLEPVLHLGDRHPAQIRHPVTWSRSPLRTPTPPPALGEHTAQVRARLEDVR
jgi:crotonobetainyl-CoA:carnitine CoA-transferase CaiB-like acyl-CoA transferase